MIPSTHAYSPAPARLALSGRFVVAGRDGPIPCRPAFDVYAAQCGAMAPEIVTGVTGVEAARIHRRWA